MGAYFVWVLIILILRYRVIAVTVINHDTMINRKKNKMA